jgi:hypothetical protein
MERYIKMPITERQPMFQQPKRQRLKSEDPYQTSLRAFDLSGALFSSHDHSMENP